VEGAALRGIALRTRGLAQHQPVWRAPVHASGAGPGVTVITAPVLVTLAGDIGDEHGKTAPSHVASGKAPSDSVAVVAPDDGGAAARAARRSPRRRAPFR
jgi:hypothetical protein